jgi:hypothetical protein
MASFEEMEEMLDEIIYYATTFYTLSAGLHIMNI